MLGVITMILYCYLRIIYKTGGEKSHPCAMSPCGYQWNLGHQTLDMPVDIGKF